MRKQGVWKSKSQRKYLGEILNEIEMKIKTNFPKTLFFVDFFNPWKKKFFFGTKTLKKLSVKTLV